MINIYNYTEKQIQNIKDRAYESKKPCYQIITITNIIIHIQEINIELIKIAYNLLR